MKQCPNCGKACSEGQAFCAGCGTALSEAAAPQPAPEPEQPTIQIPPIQQPVQPAEIPHPPAGDPFATGPVGPAPVQAKPPVPAPPRPPVPPQVPAKKLGGAAAAAIVLAVCAVLAAAGAGFAGYQAVQLKKSYEAEQSLRIAAEQEAASIQEELDRLQLSQDRTAAELADAALQLEDARGQLEDVSGQLTDGSSRLQAAEQELESLIDLLSGELGYASPSFYSTRDVVVVRKGSSVTVPLYIEPVEGAVYTLDCTAAGNAISCQWAGESIVYGENAAVVTGNEEGCYLFSVHDDVGYGNLFRVLVIVTG